MDDGGVLPSSAVRLVIGAVGVGMAMLVFVADHSYVAGRLGGWTIAMLLAAAFLALTGLEGVRRCNRRQREIEQAFAEWTGLRRELAGRKDPARWLQQRGYHEFEVRHWIQHEVARDVGAGEA